MFPDASITIINNTILLADQYGRPKRPKKILITYYFFKKPTKTVETDKKKLRKCKTNSAPHAFDTRGTISQH